MPIPPVNRRDKRAGRRLPLAPLSLAARPVVNRRFVHLPAIAAWALLTVGV
jgi:hypothetical protein